MEKATYDSNTFQSNDQLELAEQYIQHTNENIFLTGKAGTGKTTFLHRLRSTTHKRFVVVAPTGVAAINAKGVTIHSFFQLPFGPFMPGSGIVQKDQSRKFQRKFRKEKQNIIRTLDLLIIDEISMVRSDVLDAIDEVLRRYKHNNRPFGGVQLLMIGDIHQLAPVVKQDEWSLLSTHYETPYFFGSLALKETGCIRIELTEVFRQKDKYFIDLLNSIRDGVADEKEFEALNKRFKPNAEKEENEGYVTLCTHNYQAQKINDARLAAISSREYLFKAEVSGKFPEHMFPIDDNLKLKVGAQVMFTRNDPSPEKLYFNGKMGHLVNIENEEITVQCRDEKETITVGRVVWNNYDYSLDPETKQIEETVAGSFEQIPLKPAWAITIHKSQGLTFDRAIIDAERAFAHGQVYVALSRCRSLDGLILSSPIGRTSIKSDTDVEVFSERAEKNTPTQETLSVAQKKYELQLVIELFSFDSELRSLRILTSKSTKYQSVLVGDVREVFLEVSNSFERDVVGVSKKFRQQLSTMFQNNDGVELNQRIKKAIDYFVPKLLETLEHVENVSVESDNTAVRKELQLACETCLLGLQKKVFCLQACADGFDQSKYIKSRAEAELLALNRDGQKDDKKKITLADTDHPVLYENIRTWRHNKHKIEDVPHYRILSQKSLLELTKVLPLSKSALKSVHGIGKKKIERYGDELLKMIAEYCTLENITPPQPEVKVARRRPTAEISLALYQSGKSIDEIASERNLAVSTISTHLADMVGLGVLDVRDFIPDKKLKAILSAFDHYGFEQLTPVKEALGSEYSYTDLRFVQKHLFYRYSLNSNIE